MMAQVKKEFGRIDILINNAGFTRFIDFADLEKLTEEIWDNLFAVNLKGTFFCCRAVAPIMQEQGSGGIVNIASVAGITGQGSCIGYCASKAGVISLTKSMARALGPNILVNAVAPALTETRWLDDVARAPQMRENFKKASVLNRMGEAGDVAEVALSLSADWSFVTGQIVVVDGGRML
jgi:3-oxoacyl-[acyl-carrier protein] reductase